MSASENTNSSVINMEKCKAILLDVAGTTTSINFVKETLFPYAVKQAEEFLKTNWEEEVVKTAVKSLKDTEELDLKKATDLFKELTEKNDENAAVKTLQGLIYKKGYEDGELKAHVFEDVPSALEMWSKSRQVAIFSTGSLDSQKLLFKHTTGGDLSAHLNEYFDQSIGSKLESESYVKIAEKMNCKPEEVVFITDNADEAKAAKSAKFEVAIIKREGNTEIPEETLKEYTVLSSFKEITIENSSKRKVEEESTTTEVPPSKIAKTESTDKTEAKADDKKTEKEEEVKSGDSEEKMEVDSAEKPKEETVAEETKTKEPAKLETESKDSNTTDKTEEKTESGPVEEKKTSEEKVEPAAEKKVEEKVPVEAETQKEDCIDSKTKETTEEKTEGSKKEKELAAEPETKGEETEKTEPEKVEVEKENKSEIANGVDSTNAEEKNGVSEKTNGDKNEDALDNKSEETEIKVKKIEETSDTTTTTSEVSVEA